MKTGRAATKSSGAKPTRSERIFCINKPKHWTFWKDGLFKERVTSIVPLKEKRESDWWFGTGADVSSKQSDRKLAISALGLTLTFEAHASTSWS